VRATLDEKKFKPHDRMIDRLLDQGYASTDICSALISMLQGAAGGGPGGGGFAGAPAAPAKPAVGGASAASAPAKPARAAIAPTAPATAPATKVVKGAPDWAKPVAYVKPKPALAAAHAKPKAAESLATPAAALAAEASEAPAVSEGDDQDDLRPRKSKYERPARTGREPGMKTIFLNVGRKQLVTPADIVGKIAGVTRLPANAVGALDIHQRHTLVDVAAAEAEFIVKKLAGIMLKGVALAPAMAGPDNDIKET
jgi:ATP-dependent RNA helicase DeaD